MSSVLSRLKKRADTYHRKYLIAKATRKDGKIQCFITKRWYLPEYLQVAHFLDRERLCVRYYDINCHLVIKNSNYNDSKVFNENLYGDLSKHHYEYKNALINCYGMPTFEDLMSYEDNCTGLSREDYEEYIEEFIKVINGQG